MLMRGRSESPLLAEIATLQAEVDAAKGDLAVAKQRLEASRAHERILAVYAEASYWAFSRPRTSETAWLGSLATAAVRILGWDSAFIIEWPSATVLTAAGAGIRQRETVEALLSTDDAMKRRSASRALFSSLSGSEREGLVLRAAFNADEVVAVPVTIHKKRTVYLAVAIHSGHRLHPASEEPLLAKFAATAGRFAEAAFDR